MKTEEPGVDVAELMERVRRNVEEKRKAGVYKDEAWTENFRFASGSHSGSDSLALLRSSARVDLEGESIQSHRRLTGGFIVGLKRFTRYWVRKYTDPLFLRQGTFNAETVNALTALRQEVLELREEVELLKSRAAGQTEAREPGSDRQ